MATPQHFFESFEDENFLSRLKFTLSTADSWKFTFIPSNQFEIHLIHRVKLRILTIKGIDDVDENFHDKKSALSEKCVIVRKISKQIKTLPEKN